MKKHRLAFAWTLTTFAVGAAFSATGCGQTDSGDFREITLALSPDMAGQAAEQVDTYGVVSVDEDSGDSQSPVKTPEIDAADPATVETSQGGTTEPSDTESRPVVSAEPAEKPEAIESPETPAPETRDPGTPAPESSPVADAKAAEAKNEIKLLIPTRDFKTEGPENALRVSFDDVDLMKVLNMEPVIASAPQLLPKWLKDLDGKRIRLRGFMYPPFDNEDLPGFVLARDNEICCFGRNPKVYDLVSVVMRENHTTDYIEGRPFDVVGDFHIGDTIEPGELFWIDNAIVIKKN
jgi:hypothetical protein